MIWRNSFGRLRLIADARFWAARSALKRRDAAHEFVHDFADDPRPASLLVTGSSFHNQGLNR
jgi:hypothetical protein